MGLLPRSRQHRFWLRLLQFSTSVFEEPMWEKMWRESRKYRAYQFQMQRIHLDKQEFQVSSFWLRGVIRFALSNCALYDENGIVEGLVVPSYRGYDSYKCYSRYGPALAKTRFSSSASAGTSSKQISQHLTPIHTKHRTHKSNFEDQPHSCIYKWKPKS